MYTSHRPKSNRSPPSSASRLSTHCDVLRAHAPCPPSPGCYSPWCPPYPLEGELHEPLCASTAAAVLLLATSAYAQEPPPLRAAVDGTFAPHAFPNLSGGYQGFNVDLANEIAKRLKRKIMIDAAQFSGLVPALQAGTYDFLAAPTTVTKERAENMLFTEGYLNTDFQFLIKKGSPKVEKLEDLKGKTVSVNKGSAYDSWARDLEGKSDGKSSPSVRRPMRFRRCWSGVPMPMLPAIPSSHGRSRTTRSSNSVLFAFDRSGLGRALAQGFRRAAQDARRRDRMHEARWHDREDAREMVRRRACRQVRLR